MNLPIVVPIQTAVDTGRLIIDGLADPRGALGDADVLDIDLGFTVKGWIELPGWLSGRGSVRLFADELGGPSTVGAIGQDTVIITGSTSPDDPPTIRYSWSIKVGSPALPDDTSKIYRFGVAFMMDTPPGEQTDVGGFSDLGTFLVLGAEGGIRGSSERSPVSRGTRDGDGGGHDGDDGEEDLPDESDEDRPVAERRDEGWTGPGTTPFPQAASEPVEASTSGRMVHPRLDVDGHHGRSGVVVVDEPFDVTVGIAARRDRSVTSTGPMRLSAGSLMLDAVFAYDPDSLEPLGETRRQLQVTPDNPFPAVSMKFIAKYGEDIGQERRIGIHYLLDGHVIGFARKTIIAVDTVADVDRAPDPQGRESSLLDLTPLLGQDAPDLILAVFRPDSGSGTRFVWSAYPAASGIWVPDKPCTGKDLGDVTAFATNTRRTIQFGRDEFAIFRELQGNALLIGDAIPPSIRFVLHAAATAPERTAAAAILLLTEEVYVPWELASFRNAPLRTPFGGDSPFLGAHVAIGRWPLADGEPKPVLCSRVDVGHSAVLSADYTGVPGWPKLDNAVSEAEAVAGRYPPATKVKPRYDEVIALFDGTPPVDVVHVALHGQFDAQGTNEGLVLVAETPDGKRTPQFLKPIEVEEGNLLRRPFVFLNACQVGSDKQVLGDCGGLASTLLRKGAAGVVAPLWNVNDAVASTIALGLYADAYGPDRTAIAEYLRRVRARYTAPAAQARTPDVTSTLIAYQLFGHPRLTLWRAPS